MEMADVYDNFTRCDSWEKIASSHKVAENKRYGVRIRNALKKEQDRLDDKSIAAAKEDGQKKSAKENHEMRLRRTQIAAQSRRFYDLWTEYNNQQVAITNHLHTFLISD